MTMTQSQTIVEKLDKCRQLRGLPVELSHRTYGEFASFVHEMIDYLVFGRMSQDEDIRELQKEIKRERYRRKAQRFETYADLFLKHWKQLDRQHLNEFRETLPDQVWILNHHSELQPKYANKYIAVRKGKVVAAGKNYVRVYRSASRKEKYFAIERVLAPEEIASRKTQNQNIRKE